MSEWLAISPSPGAEFIRAAKRLVIADEARRRERLHQLRKALNATPSGPKTTVDLEARVATHVLLDLVGQGWSVRVERDEVSIRMPAAQAPSKDRVRRVHLQERDARLRETSVREFVERMERRRLTSKGWHSIFSLMRDGRDLRDKLAASLTAESAAERDGVLAQTIQPYLEFVTGEELCPQTGLMLRDVWRYFRLTWTNVYKSVPGRSMLILVRDAAAPNHPVIGIASLGSSVVQQDLRDRWIGWHPATFVESMQARPHVKTMQRLLANLDALIKDIYTADLLRDGLVTRAEVRNPSDAAIDRLRKEALRARAQHHRYPTVASMKGSTDWRAQATTSLFRSKRADHLAGLLSIRRALKQHPMRTIDQVRDALGHSEVRDALRQLIRRIKSVHVGIDMMDLTVCGAVAPYNHVLGGKLVCMLLTSPEIVQRYARRYEDQSSIIASSMKGRAVKRHPRLVALFTTSLYAAGSSQYNRVKIPCELVGGEAGKSIRYEELGHSEGYGSFHFSSSTISEINVLLSRRIEGRRVNSIFGEGVNPLMRKIREALEQTGFPADAILRHGMPRLVYAVKLATNASDVLLGLTTRPRYLIPHDRFTDRSRMIAAFWRKRWLSSRINTPGILDAVGTHSLAYPVQHGARVPLPADTEIVKGQFSWQS
jgi:hypothetical protein